MLKKDQPATTATTERAEPPMAAVPATRDTGVAAPAAPNRRAHVHEDAEPQDDEDGYGHGV